MGLSLHIFPLDPDRLFEFISVQRYLCTAVDITVKPGKKVIHYPPRLRLVIAYIPDFQSDFFHNLSGDSLFQCLSDLVETRHQRVERNAPSCVFGHKDPVSVRHTDDNRRKDAGIDRSSAVRTEQRPFRL